MKTRSEVSDAPAAARCWTDESTHRTAARASTLVSPCRSTQLCASSNPRHDATCQDGSCLSESALGRRVGRQHVIVIFHIVSHDAQRQSTCYASRLSATGRQSCAPLLTRSKHCQQNACKKRGQKVDRLRSPCKRTSLWLCRRGCSKTDWWSAVRGRACCTRSPPSFSAMAASTAADIISRHSALLGRNPILDPTHQPLRREHFLSDGILSWSGSKTSIVSRWKNKKILSDAYTTCWGRIF